MRKLKSVAIGILIATLSIATFAMAQSFFFNWTQIPYDPDEYVWEEPWTVQVAVDYIEAILDVTGSGYQGDLHDFVLSFENVASDPQGYILQHFDYEVKWIVTPDEEVITSGTFDGTLLVGDAPIEYLGAFSPTLAGSGNIAMNLINIDWVAAEPISWTTNVINPFPEYATVDSATVEGATLSYMETGEVVILFSAPSPGLYVDFTITIPEEGTTSHTLLMATGSGDEFRYEFGPLTIGGSLTVTVEVTGTHT